MYLQSALGLGEPLPARHVTAQPALRRDSDGAGWIAPGPNGAFGCPSVKRPPFQATVADWASFLRGPPAERPSPCHSLEPEPPAERPSPSPAFSRKRRAQLVSRARAFLTRTFHSRAPLTQASTTLACRRRWRREPEPSRSFAAISRAVFILLFAFSLTRAFAGLSCLALGDSIGGGAL